MKILILTLDDYPHCGGKSTHMASLIEGLNEKNVDVEVLSGNLISKWKLQLKKLLVYYNKLINPKKYLYLRKKIQFDLFVEVLRKKCHFDQYDCISCQDALSCTAVGRINNDINKTLTMHTYFGLEFTLDNKYLSEDDEYYKILLNLELESLNYANNIVAVDQRIKDHIIEILDIMKKNKKCKVSSIANFTNTNLYNTEKKEHDTFNIMCVRRLVEKNGVFYAAEAIKNVKEDVILHIYGTGPEEQRIQELIQKENLQNKIIMHGSIDNSQLPEIYKSCDLVLVPSITVNGLQEATSISAIEAMSCGIPVIASDIGGLSQMIENNKNGILVREKDSTELANKISELYNDNKKCEFLGKNSRKYVLENHSHITAAQKYLEIFISKDTENEKN